MSQNIDSSQGTNEVVGYPFLAVRYTPEHIRREDIVFVRKSEKEFILADSDNLVIAVPDYLEDDQEFVELSRDVILDSARLHMASLAYPLCVVFGPNDCVYLEHDGTEVHSRQSPFVEEELC